MLHTVDVMSEAAARRPLQPAGTPGLRWFTTGQALIAASPALHLIFGSGSPWVTYMIVAVTVALSRYAQTRPVVKVAWLHDHDAILDGERHRLITAAYIHAGLLHLAFNMLALWSFGRNLEGFFLSQYGFTGAWLFAASYLVGAGICGTLALFGERILGSYPSLGASAVVLMVVAASIIINPSTTLFIFFFPMPGWLFLSAFSAISAYALVKGSRAVDAFMTFGTGRVNHLGHLAGVATGIILGAVLLLA